MSEMKVNEKKVVRRSVTVSLGIVCVIVVAGLVGAFAYYHYTPIISDKDNTISSLNAEISYLNFTLLNLQQQVGVDNFTIWSLTNQMANLQNQLGSLMNGTRTSLDIVTTNSPAWVNKTVLVQGFLNKLDYGVYLPWQMPPPWNYLLVSWNYFDQIGVLWNGAAPNSSQVQIHGVVRQGPVNLNGTDITVFYIEAETVNPI